MPNGILLETTPHSKEKKRNALGVVRDFSLMSLTSNNVSFFFHWTITWPSLNYLKKIQVNFEHSRIFKNHWTLNDARK